MCVEKGHQLIDKAGIPLRRGIITYTLDAVGIVGQLFQYLAVNGIYLGNTRRITAAQHINRLVAVKRVAQVIH